MAKLQFLRVGWGGDDDVPWTCTHAGCYATVFVMSLQTCWMLRNCVCLVIAHMLDATQLCLSCHCTHAGCYASVSVVSLHACWMLRLSWGFMGWVGWGGVEMMMFVELAHMLDATQLCLSCHCTHAGCYATVFGGICLVVFNWMNARPTLLEALGIARRWWQNDVFFSADGSNNPRIPS